MKRFLTILFPLLAAVVFSASNAVAEVAIDVCNDMVRDGLTGCELTCGCAIRECEPDGPESKDWHHRAEMKELCEAKCATHDCSTLLSDIDRFNCVTRPLGEEDPRHFGECQMSPKPADTTDHLPEPSPIPPPDDATDPVEPPPPPEEEEDPTDPIIEDVVDTGDEPVAPIVDGACSGWIVESGSVACCLIIFGDVSGDVSQVCTGDPCALFYRTYGTVPTECRPDLCSTNPEAAECRAPVLAPAEIPPAPEAIVSNNITPGNIPTDFFHAQGGGCSLMADTNAGTPKKLTFVVGLLMAVLLTVLVIRQGRKS